MNATAFLFIAVPVTIYSIWAVLNPEEDPFFGIGLKNPELTQTGRLLSYVPVFVSVVFWFGLLLLVGDPFHWIIFGIIALGTFLISTDFPLLSYVTRRNT